MGRDVFHFKQFTVNQGLCPMKVGADGLTLGAWANTHGCLRILDAGTGTGLIALMMAQRNSQAIIEAVDIDPNACWQAKENVLASPFASRIRVINENLSTFECPSVNGYDLIASNPPYFADSLKSSDEGRNLARHDDSLTLETLLASCRRLLSPSGRIALILPFDRENELRSLAAGNCLYITRLARLIYKEGKPPKRLLVELSPVYSIPAATETLTVHESDGAYTADYSFLTREFYL